jgi:Rrf2 family protein
MKLSTRSRYGMRALLELGLHYGEGPMLIRDVATRQQVSQYYLEQIVLQLRTAGLVRSLRGAKGGISLAKSPREIRLSDALVALGGMESCPVECVDDADICNRSSTCAMRDVWTEVKESMAHVLESKTLQDLVEMQQKKGVPGMATYAI